MTRNEAVMTISSVKMPSRAKLVYLAIAHYSNKKDEAFPSTSTIAEHAGVSESTVHRAIADLVSMALVTAVARKRANNGDTSNLYILERPENVTPPEIQNDRGEGVSLAPQEPELTISNESNLSVLTDRPVSPPDSAEEKAEENKMERRELEAIIERCELEYIPKDWRPVFRDSISRLYYAEKLKIGGITLPRHVVRSSLSYLDYSKIECAMYKLKFNAKAANITNSAKYVMVTLYNAISEEYADLWVKE